METENEHSLSSRPQAPPEVTAMTVRHRGGKGRPGKRNPLRR